jgi:hypothetical protein
MIADLKATLKEELGGPPVLTIFDAAAYKGSVCRGV